MDTKLINKYGEDILSYRLRTARHKKRMQHKDFEKQLINLYKKDKELSKISDNLGWKQLAPPVQKGWIRCFVLREDVAISIQADFFESILKKINTYKYSWRKDFKEKRKKWGRKIYVTSPQYLEKLDEYKFKKLDFSDKEKKFFYEVWEMNVCHQLVKVYIFSEPWRFVLKVKPNMIEKVKIIDGELESQIKWIENYLERNGLNGKLLRLLHGSDRWRIRWSGPKYNEENFLKNKSFAQVLDYINEEKEV